MTIPRVENYLKNLSSISSEVGHTTFDDYLVIICNLTKSKSKRENIIKTVSNFNDQNVKSSISISYSPFSKSSYAFTQTRVLSRLGYLKYPGRNTYVIEDMNLDYFMYKCRRNQLIDMLIPEKLKQLMAYDKAKGSTLVDLLYIYLDNERSVTKTSELSYLHRNTTMYQLSKIKEIMNTEFEDSDERFVYLIALKLLKTNPPDVSEYDSI